MSENVAITEGEEVARINQREIGLYADVPFLTYQLDTGLNFSDLKQIDESPEHFHLSRMFRQDISSDEMRFGRAYHHHLLEHKTFPSHYLITPKVRKAGENWDKLKLQAAAENREILFEEDFEIIQTMRKKLASHALVPGLIAGSKKELSIFWQEHHGEGNVERCKARIDCYNEKVNVLADFKTVESAHPRDFIKTLFSYKYDCQLAWYMKALRAVGIKPDSALIVAQSKKRPYSVMVYELDADTLAVAERENAERLDRFFTCKVAKAWPGYPEVAFKVRPPEWKMNKYFGNGKTVEES